MNGTVLNIRSGAASCILAASLAFASATASAVAFKLDGHFDGMEPYSLYSNTVKWYNGHKNEDSKYGKKDDDPSKWSSTSVYSGTGKEAVGTIDYFWVYVEVPLYAKNMIWQDKKDTTDPGLEDADLIPYGAADMDFKKATGSEKMKLVKSGFEANLNGDTKNLVTTTYGILLGFKDSVDYLIDASLCTQALCLARDTTMAFEFKFTKDEPKNAAFLALFDSGIEFHLSPERQGALPPNDVPEPGTLALLIAGLGGLLARRRRQTARV